jgi:hypothetical protein
MGPPQSGAARRADRALGTSVRQVVGAQRAHREDGARTPVEPQRSHPDKKR